MIQFRFISFIFTGFGIRTFSTTQERFACLLRASLSMIFVQTLLPFMLYCLVIFFRFSYQYRMYCTYISSSSWILFQQGIPFILVKNSFRFSSETLLQILSSRLINLLPSISKGRLSILKIFHLEVANKIWSTKE